MVVYSDRLYEPVCTKGRNSYCVLTLLGNKQERVLRLTVYKVYDDKEEYRSVQKELKEEIQKEKKQYKKTEESNFTYEPLSKGDVSDPTST